MNDLKKELQRIDTIGQELKKDHPDNSRTPIEIVKSDIQFEKGFAKTLSEQKLKAIAAVVLFKTGVLFDEKKPVGDKIATVKAANKKLKPYFRVDKNGNIYFLPIVSDIPSHFHIPYPSFAMTPDQAIALIDDLAAQNDVQLAKRKSQLSLLEQEQRLRDELSSLERKAKTVADLWIYDPHLEDTGRKNTYKAVVGTTLQFKIMARYNDNSDETLTHDDAKGILLFPSDLKVDSAKKYKVHVHFSNGKNYNFTVEGYYRQDLISFVKADYRAKEGLDEIITIELHREGTGKGRVTARFREILGKGTSAGDYAVIDPFPTWEDGEDGEKLIRVKIYDNKDSSYNKVITLQLEPISGADLKEPKSTQITIEDDDMGGSLRIMAPRYNVDETDKTVRIGIERVGERVLNSVTVRIPTLNGSAKEGEDYKAFSDTLTWGPTDKDIKPVEIPIIEDKVEEGAETFHAILSDPTGGAVLDTPNTTEITIRDVKDRQDGIQKARFSKSEYRVGEGSAGIRITVHREGGVQGEFKVDYLTQDAYAWAGKDYETSHGTLTWKDGDDRPQDFIVKIIDDQELKPRLETIHLQLENPRNPEVSVGFDATGTEAVIYIEDNDSETDEKPPETDTPTTSSIEPGICGCGMPDDDKNGNGIPDCEEKIAILSGIQMNPASAAIEVTELASFSVTVFDADGNPLSSKDMNALSFEWAVSDPSVASISGAGARATVTPIQEGTVTVIAVSSQVNAFATVVIRSADEDKDGVPDARDFCPGTPAGTRVDDQGCPDQTGCLDDSDCPQGYACDPQSGKCVPPFDDSYAGFSDQLAQRDDQRTWDNIQQVISDQSANTDKDRSSDDLDQDLNKIQDYLSVECSDNKPCPDGYNCENGKCVKKHDDDKKECTKPKDCPRGHECKDGKCVKKSKEKPKILAITPANKAVKINELATLQAILKMKDETAKDVTREATWNPGNLFSKGNIDQYTVKTTYNDLHETAMITMVKEKGMDDITVNSKTINVTFYDHGNYEDGDMIDILINGKVVFSGITLTFAHQYRSITMNADVIVFGFRALNEGTKKPNTAAVIFTNVTKGKKEQQYTLKKNQETNMNITYSP